VQKLALRHDQFLDLLARLRYRVISNVDRSVCSDLRKRNAIGEQEMSIPRDTDKKKQDPTPRPPISLLLRVSPTEIHKRAKFGSFVAKRSNKSISSRHELKRRDIKLGHLEAESIT
jgi:hypothetical protein